MTTYYELRYWAQLVWNRFYFISAVLIRFLVLLTNKIYFKNNFNYCLRVNVQRMIIYFLSKLKYAATKFFSSSKKRKIKNSSDHRTWTGKRMKEPFIKNLMFLLRRVELRSKLRTQFLCVLTFKAILNSNFETIHFCV